MPLLDNLVNLFAGVPAKPPLPSPPVPARLTSAPGMRVPGNIDLNTRPMVRNADGSISTVRSMSFGNDQGEVLVPTVSEDGRIMSDNQAINLYKDTGRQLGIFDTPDNATTYALGLHKQQEQQYVAPSLKRKR